MHANPTGILANGRTIAQCLEDTRDGIGIHGHEEARAELRTRSASGKESRRGVRELLVAQQVIRLKGALQVIRPKTKSHAHPQMLRTLTNHQLGVLQKIRLFQSLESEIIQLIIALVVNRPLNGSGLLRVRA